MIATGRGHTAAVVADMALALVIASAIAADTSETVARGALTRGGALLRETEVTGEGTGGGGGIAVLSSTITLFPNSHDAIAAANGESWSENARRTASIRINVVPVIALLTRTESAVTTAGESELGLAVHRTAITGDRITIIALLTPREDTVPASGSGHEGTGAAATISVDGIPVVTLLPRVEVPVAAQRKRIGERTVCKIADGARACDRSSNLTLLPRIAVAISAEGTASHTAAG